MPRTTFHCPTTREFRSFTKQVWARNRWGRGQPKKTTIQAQRQSLHCSQHRSTEKAIWRRYKGQFYRYRALRQVAPYPGYSGHGLGLTWLAIPRAIVDCEGGPDWNKWNTSGSGAFGPYQLLGHGEPIPVNSWHDQIVTHRIARSLYESSGTGPWVSSSGCWG